MSELRPFKSHIAVQKWSASVTKVGVAHASLNECLASSFSVDKWCNLSKPPRNKKIKKGVRVAIISKEQSGKLAI